MVGGELRSAGELILGPLRETVAQRAVPAAAAAAEIVPSMLGDRAELIGAICLALDAVGASIVHDALSEGMPAGD